MQLPQGFWRNVEKEMHLFVSPTDVFEVGLQGRRFIIMLCWMQLFFWEGGREGRG